ncbi:MAG: VOC family protein [Mucilaginibacter sp.]
MQKLTTFLMFEGRAEEAMNFYISLFKQSGIVSISHYDASEPGTEGTVKHAVFSLNGQEFMCIDSHATHGFTFTPAMSIFVNCETEPEIEHLFGKLAEDGQVLMPIGSYPFSKKFGWVSDKFGVSWQVSLK